jgi:two-component system KDP operon response regulator KdpE
MHCPRILIADDDQVVIKFLRASLEAGGYQTLIAMDGAEALETIERELPDLVVLDIMMPKMDGFEVCRRLREWSKTPIIVLSAWGDVSDKVKCLDLGADDYITKPFAVDELMARVRSVFRRTETTATTSPQPSFSSGDLQINFVERRITVAGNEVRLTPTEYSLLKELILNAGKVLLHSYLLKRVWGPEYGHEREYLRVFVSRLRAKLEPVPTNPRYIITVPGVGYQFKNHQPKL